MRIAKVNSFATKSDVIITVSSEDKPDMLDAILMKWQQIVDLAAKIIGVPSGLITRLSEDQLEVYLTSNTDNNIFEANAKFELGAGWYCETVAAHRNELVLPNALKSEEWKENPSVAFNMISYMGVPIFWPDGEVFGTFCMLDNKENPYSKEYIELMKALKEVIQSDLKSVQLYNKAQKDLTDKDYQIREVHHRVKNHFNLLINALSIQSFLGTCGDPKTILKEIQSRIFAISSIHDKLYHSINLEQVLLGEYLSELGKYIVDTVSQSEIEFICNCDEIKAGADITLPCGLLLNELITNSVKYAFKGVPKPKIDLKLSIINDRVHFVYSDNGCGMEKDFDPESCESLGLILIKQLVLKLDGKYQILNENGFVFEAKFTV